MSSILDALNKSEAERRRAPPGLNTPLTFASAPPPRRRKSWLLPVIAVAALGLAWAGGLFDFGGVSDERTAIDTQATTPSGTAEPENATLSTTEDAGSTALTSDPQPEPAAAEGLPAPRAGGFGPRRPSQSANSEPATAPVPQESAPAPLPVPEPPEPLVAAPPATGQPTQEADGSVSGKTTPPASAAQSSQVATDAPAPSSAQISGSDGIPSLNDLPFATRRTLPALNMTMHLYSADPSRRLVLLNGEQARDGDELDGGITIRAIRPDGVVIVYENTEFLLPSRN